jgi:hypothetical protein
MRILFVTSNRLGDAVLSTGLLDHLIRTHPTARITVVCGPVAEGVFDRMPNRERTIVLRKQPRGRHWLPLWATTVGHVWDLVVDIRGSALAYLVPTRRRAIYRPMRGPKIAQLAAVLNLSPPPLPVAWFSDADRIAVARLLPTGRPIIALARGPFRRRVQPPASGICPGCPRRSRPGGAVNGRAIAGGVATSD